MKTNDIGVIGDDMNNPCRPCWRNYNVEADAEMLEIDQIIELLDIGKGPKFWICAAESIDTRWNWHGEGTE
jgi:hypothetical protein